MPKPFFLPTRHQFLEIAAFFRRIHAHRQDYVLVDLDLPTEIYSAHQRVNGKVDASLLLFSRQAEKTAGLKFVMQEMGVIWARYPIDEAEKSPAGGKRKGKKGTASVLGGGKFERLPRGWMDEQK